MPRIHFPEALTPACVGQTRVLRDAAARHVQVLRLQPGQTLTLFDGGLGAGGEFSATVLRMGRSDVELRLDAHQPIEREATRAVHLALGVPTGDRMDWLVEKATELGVASIQPLMTERSVLRLAGERAAKKQAHWQAIAVAACEQCGRNRVPVLHPVRGLDEWLAPGMAQRRHVLSLQGDAVAWAQALLDPNALVAANAASAANAAHATAAPAGAPNASASASPLGQPASAEPAFWLLSGPEGGLAPAEEARARAAGCRPVNLGPRVLRADTAPLAALALATLL